MYCLKIGNFIIYPWDYLFNCNPISIYYPFHKHFTGHKLCIGYFPPKNEPKTTTFTNTPTSDFDLCMSFKLHFLMLLTFVIEPCKHVSFVFVLCVTTFWEYNALQCSAKPTAKMGENACYIAQQREYQALGIDDGFFCCYRCQYQTCSSYPNVESYQVFWSQRSTVRWLVKQIGCLIAFFQNGGGGCTHILLCWVHS